MSSKRGGNCINDVRREDDKDSGVVTTEQGREMASISVEENAKFLTIETKRRMESSFTILQGF